MHSAGFEPAIRAGERLQTHALDRSATGIGAGHSISLYHSQRDVLATAIAVTGPYVKHCSVFSSRCDERDETFRTLGRYLECTLNFGREFGEVGSLA